MKRNTSKPSTSRTFKAVAIACLAIAGMSSAQASVSLADLISTQGSILSGDKLFSNFAYVTSSLTFSQASDVQVEADTVGGNFGIGFVSAWHANPGQGLQSAKITYTVSIQGNEGLYISDIHLDGDPSLVGDAGQSVVKLSASDLAHTTVLPAPDSLLRVYKTIDNPAVVNASADTVGAPANLRVLDIETTILQSADAVNANTSVLHIQESFSQSVVPEPSSYALMLVGLMAIGYRLRSPSRIKS
jgi:hypothetical protein